jgi:hypothetical protein
MSNLCTDCLLAAHKCKAGQCSSLCSWSSATEYQDMTAKSGPASHKCIKLGRHITHSACNAVGNQGKSRMHPPYCAQAAHVTQSCWSGAWLQSVPYITSGQTPIKDHKLVVGHTTSWRATPSPLPSSHPRATTPLHNHSQHKIRFWQLGQGFSAKSTSPLSPVRGANRVSCTCQTLHPLQTRYAHWVPPCCRTAASCFLNTRTCHLLLLQLCASSMLQNELLRNPTAGCAHCGSCV